MPEGVVYETLSRELMRKLRGKRSQRLFSKVMGFDSNVAYSWETGRRSPETSVFFRAAGRADAGSFQRILAFLEDAPQELQKARFSSPRTVQALVVHLAAHSPRVELAARLGVDRTTLARWLKGTTEPRLPEFLRLIDLATQRLLAFVELFANPADLAATRDAYRDLLAQRKLAYELPWSHAVLRALELEAYRKLPAHKEGFLSGQIGISVQDEQRYLEELVLAGQVRWKGTHYEVQHVLTVDTRQDPTRNRELKTHWATVGVERSKAPDTPPDALFSFNLFAISHESFQQIRELHLEYYDRVRGIIEESPKSEQVVLMNLQLVPLGPPSVCDREAEDESRTDATGRLVG